MKGESPKSLDPSEDLRNAFRTMTGFPAASDELGIRLQKVADLISQITSGPRTPFWFGRNRGNRSSTFNS
jgi:hypothetical protein